MPTTVVTTDTSFPQSVILVEWMRGAFCGLLTGAIMSTGYISGSYYVVGFALAACFMAVSKIIVSRLVGFPSCSEAHPMEVFVGYQLLAVAFASLISISPFQVSPYKVQSKYSGTVGYSKVSAPNNYVIKSPGVASSSSLRGRRVKIRERLGEIFGGSHPWLIFPVFIVAVTSYVFIFWVSLLSLFDYIFFRKVALFCGCVIVVPFLFSSGGDFEAAGVLLSAVLVTYSAILVVVAAGINYFQNEFMLNSIVSAFCMCLLVFAVVTIPYSFSEGQDAIKALALAAIVVLIVCGFAYYLARALYARVYGEESGASRYGSRLSRTFEFVLFVPALLANYMVVFSLISLGSYVSYTSYLVGRIPYVRSRISGYAILALGGGAVYFIFMLYGGPTEFVIFSSLREWLASSSVKKEVFAWSVATSVACSAIAKCERIYFESV